MSRDEAHTKRYQYDAYSHRGRTSFYGSTDGGDLVTPIQAVHSAIFQSVAPFHEQSLSTSRREIRTKSGRRSVIRERAATIARRRAYKAKGEGNRLDITV